MVILTLIRRFITTWFLSRLTTSIALGCGCLMVIIGCGMIYAGFTAAGWLHF